MTSQRPTDDLESLEARLAEAKRKAFPEPAPLQVAGSAFGQGTRLALELVSGVLVGAGLGYLLDRWLGTTPWLMLLFFMLGLYVGFRNLLRTVNREAAKVSQAELDRLPKVPEDEER